MDRMMGWSRGLMWCRCVHVRAHRRPEGRASWWCHSPDWENWYMLPRCISGSRERESELEETGKRAGQEGGGGYPCGSTEGDAVPP